MLECTTSEVKLREIVNQAEGLDYNEWLASHTIAFFEHINLLYGTISEFCSNSGCPDMSGPCNRYCNIISFYSISLQLLFSPRQYLWMDEKGKRIKLTAPQYVDYVMTYAQKAINDESIFPTKFDREFPPTFVLTVKKIMKLLYHVVAHIYHSHFKEIVLLNLHPHLNCIFAHLILFNERFKLIEEKELEVLQDLAVALRVYPSRQTLMVHNPHDPNEQSRLQLEAETISYMDKQDERRCMIIAIKMSSLHNVEALVP
ncbi:MOB1-like protein [Euroglyphus maynei]|uniref:MOB1-like protein n=1 Tax=Euroglyphus maynei TaxID=6958 RepID=A0A1Y3B7L3_EURMA|nr:MOB1-like protein [Euroglyphus maynei]